MRDLMARLLCLVLTALGAACAPQSTVSCRDPTYEESGYYSGSTRGKNIRACECSSLPDRNEEQGILQCAQSAKTPLCCADTLFQTNKGGMCFCFAAAPTVCSSSGSSCYCYADGTYNSTYSSSCPAGLTNCCLSGDRQRCSCDSSSSCSTGQTKVASCPAAMMVCPPDYKQVTTCSPLIDNWL